MMSQYRFDVVHDVQFTDVCKVLVQHLHHGVNKLKNRQLILAQEDIEEEVAISRRTAPLPRLYRLGKKERRIFGRRSCICDAR